MELQLLDVAKMEHGKFSLSIADIPLSDLVQAFADDYFPMLDENGNRLEVLTDDVLPLVSCDAERIVQVLINLVSNACRHTKNGVIILSVHRIRDDMELSIADTGEGIPEALKPLLFTQFLSGAQGKAAGTGLGLYICKKTVEMHGGVITVESKRGAEQRFVSAFRCVSHFPNRKEAANMEHPYQDKMILMVEDNPSILRMN